MVMKRNIYLTTEVTSMYGDWCSYSWPIISGEAQLTDDEHCIIWEVVTDQRKYLFNDVVTTDIVEWLTVSIMKAISM